MHNIHIYTHIYYTFLFFASLICQFEKNIFKFPALIVKLPMSLYSSISLCCKHFEAILLEAYNFITFILLVDCVF